MPEDQPTADLVSVILVIAPDAIPRTDDAIRQFEAQLAALGATDLNLNRLPLFGIITCSAPADQLDALRQLPAIESVEPDETMHLRDKEEGNDTAL